MYAGKELNELVAESCGFTSPELLGKLRKIRNSGMLWKKSQGKKVLQEYPSVL